MGCNGAGESTVVTTADRPRPPAEPYRSSPDPTHSERDPTSIASKRARSFVLFVSFVVPNWLSRGRALPARHHRIRKSSAASRKWIAWRHVIRRIEVQAAERARSMGNDDLDSRTRIRHPTTFAVRFTPGRSTARRRSRKNTAADEQCRPHEGRLARGLKWKINRPSSVTAGVPRGEAIPHARDLDVLRYHRVTLLPR